MELEMSFTETERNIPVSFCDTTVISVDDSKVGSLPWSSKNTVDKLCPSFSESGSAIRCEPVEGYPLTVTTQLEATKITRCGKNLIDPEVYMKSAGSTTLDGDVFTTTFTSAGAYVNRYDSAKGVHPAGTYTVSVIPVSEDVSLAIIVYNHETGKTIKSKANVSAKNGYTLTFTADAPFRVTICGSSTASGGVFGTYSYKLQLEVGNTATAYEPYRCEIFAPGEQIYGNPGINTLYADMGDITVTGKANPSAIIEKLTIAIIALGGNV